MWDNHRKLQFPPRAKGAEVGGIDLVLLDSLTAGCISSFTTSDGKLDSAKLERLKGLSTQLRGVVPELDASVRGYFEELDALVTATLAAADQGVR